MIAHTFCQIFKLPITGLPISTLQETVKYAMSIQGPFHDLECDLILDFERNESKTTEVEGDEKL